MPSVSFWPSVGRRWSRSRPWPGWSPGRIGSVWPPTPWRRCPCIPLEQGQTELESVAVAGAVLRDSYTSSYRWYERFAESLADRQGVDRPSSRL